MLKIASMGACNPRLTHMKVSIPNSPDGMMNPVALVAEKERSGNRWRVHPRICQRGILLFIH